jgi:hypothetical protein
MTVFAAVLSVYAAIRFASLTRYVWSKGYAPIWWALEGLSCLAMLFVAITLIWGR